MELLHSSKWEIKEITETECFGDCMFFAVGSGYNLAGETNYVYSIDIDEEKIINVSELNNKGIIYEMAEDMEISENTAGKLLADEIELFEAYELGLIDEIGGYGSDKSEWYIQRKQGECAKLMGYEACKGQDEQGTVFIIPMWGRESDLNLIEKEILN